jgi:RNA polymerase sigma-70 factor (ECF subfamily)
MSTAYQDEFLKLYEQIHERFTRHCGSLAYGLMQTEDLVNDTILVTLQKFSLIRDKNKLLPFMMAVAGNIMKNHWRKNRFKSPFDEEALKKLEARINSPETALDVHYLYKALSTLHPKEKEAVLLFEVSGFSVKEIANIQHSNESAVKTRLSRARQRLREILSDEPANNKETSVISALFSITL